MTTVQSGKARLLSAAIETFAKKGFDKATTREIAEAAGMTTGALYHHYKNKEELLYDAVKESAFFVHKLSEIAEDHHLKTREELLAEISAGMVNRMSKSTEQHLMVLLIGYAMSKGGKIKEHYVLDYHALTKKVSKMLALTFGIENPHRQNVVASLMIAALDGIAVQYALGVLDIHDDGFKKDFVAFFIQSVPSYLKGE